MAFLAAACALPPGAAFAQWGGPIKVNVADVEMRAIPSSVKLVGTIEPGRRSVVSAEIAGLVEEMPARQGDYVEQGALVCKLRDATLRAMLDEAKANLASLEAIHKRWEFEQQRIESLYTERDAAVKEVYETKASFESSRYDVEEQQAVVHRIEIDLEKTEIRAPFSGFVSRRLTEVGQWVDGGGDVLELIELETVLVRVDVPETGLPYVRVGDAASVMVEAIGDHFDGTVRHVMRQADPTARTFPVEIAVRNRPALVANERRTGTEARRHEREEQQGWRERRTEGSGENGNKVTEGPGDGESEHGEGDVEDSPTRWVLGAGMFCRVTVTAGPPDQVPAIPKDAIVTRNGADFATMVVPGKEPDSLMGIPVQVMTGASIGDWIAIKSGNLRPGGQVVTLGNENIYFPSPIVIVAPTGVHEPARVADRDDVPAPQKGS